mmetsp:Transcript_4804/g.11714  ORF Transcript_4804/g.11714 Transcript_4804/m.11714 type:complete len:106 (+) Transcript_4804:1076-1393(+)
MGLCFRRAPNDPGKKLSSSGVFIAEKRATAKSFVRNERKQKREHRWVLAVAVAIAVPRSSSFETTTTTTTTSSTSSTTSLSEKKVGAMMKIELDGRVGNAINLVQ